MTEFPRTQEDIPIREGANVKLDGQLAGVKILGERPGGLVDAMVPVDLIFREDVPVDDLHVEELKRSIANESEKGDGTGQLIPILIGEIDNADKFLIIDGFHRDASLYRLGRQEVFCTIRRHTTVEEVTDLRILTANTHSSVSFARICEWVMTAWDKSQWASKISVVQAFALNSNNSSGKILGLAPKEAAQVKEWVEDKGKKWRMTPGAILGSLITADLADPELVSVARAKTNGKVLEEVTPMHLGVIAKGFPKRYDFQRLVASIATTNNFTVPMTRAVVEKLKDAANIEEARAVADVTDWSMLEPSFGKTKSKELKRKQYDNDADLGILSRRHNYGAEVHDVVIDSGISHRFLLAELAMARMGLDTSFLRGTYVSSATFERNHADWEISRADDLDVQELVAPRDTGAFFDSLAKFLERNDSSLVQSVQSKGNLDEIEAHSVVQTVSRRIIDDITNGDLRFVNFEKNDDFAIHRLVISSLRDDLRRRKDGPNRGPSMTNLEVVSTSLPDIARGLPHMPDNIRQAVVAAGLLGLTIQTTARLIGGNPALIPYFLRQGGQIVQRDVEERTRRQFFQLNTASSNRRDEELVS